MTKDILSLMEKRRFLVVPLMLRSAIDTLADLKLLLIDPENIYFIEAHRIKRQKDMMQFRIDLDPSILENPQTEADVQLAKTYNGLVKELQDFKEKGYYPLTEKAKFEKAGMVDLYRTYFAAFSMESHNNPAALDSRHLVMDENGKLLVLFDRSGSDEDYEMWCSLVAIIYVEATRVVINLFNVDGKSIIKTMIEMVEPYISSKYEAIFAFLGQ